MLILIRKKCKSTTVKSETLQYIYPLILKSRNYLFYGENIKHIRKKCNIYKCKTLKCNIIVLYIYFYSKTLLKIMFYNERR